MKKSLLIAAFSLLAFASSAHAQTVQPGHLCDSTSITNQCTSGYTCDSLTSTCVLAGNPTVNTGLPSGGGATQPINQVNLGDGTTCSPACGSGQACSGGLCIANTTQTVSQGTGNAQPGFVPLAPIPGLTADQSGNSLLGIPDLAVFLDNLYKYLIGIAAILAVIEIIVGGLQYATQDSVSKKGEGRERIEHALLGLVLVLSPALVFSIINPSILNLSLALPPLNTAPGHNVAPAEPIDQIMPCNGSDCTLVIQQCQALLAPPPTAPKQLCTKSGSSSVTGNGPPNNVSCASGYSAAIECSGTPNTNGSGQAGTTPNANTIPRFDGAYMDLVKFTGSTAQSAATAYQCQNVAPQQATANVFSGPANTANSSNYYAMCLTPQLQYVNINTGFGATPDQATAPAHSKYSGECQSIADVLAADGFTTTVVERDSVNPQQITCSQTDATASATAKCFSVYATCGVPTN